MSRALRGKSRATRAAQRPCVRRTEYINADANYLMIGYWVEGGWYFNLFILVPIVLIGFSIKRWRYVTATTTIARGRRISTNISIFALGISILAYLVFPIFGYRDGMDVPEIYIAGLGVGFYSALGGLLVVPFAKKVRLLLIVSGTTLMGVWLFVGMVWGN